MTIATVHLPFLTGAKLDTNGLLEADPANKNVKLVLPKILVTLTQDGTLGQLNFVLDSWGAATIDDPDDTGEAQLIQMPAAVCACRRYRSLWIWFRQGDSRFERQSHAA